MSISANNATASTESGGLDGTLSRLRRERGASNYGVQVRSGSRPSLLAEHFA
ncbi:MAG: hypothetical protein LBD14_00075 [Puniceicoccales bacterium]|jgi:hypothetical protein|nr:hypothetical protein [Puniceicoccales bacterium]